MNRKINQNTNTNTETQNGGRRRSKSRERGERGERGEGREEREEEEDKITEIVRKYNVKNVCITGGSKFFEEAVRQLGLTEHDDVTKVVEILFVIGKSVENSSNKV